MSAQLLTPAIEPDEDEGPECTECGYTGPLMDDQYPICWRCQHDEAEARHGETLV